MRLERGAILTIMQQNEAVKFRVVDVFTDEHGCRYAAIMRLDALPHLAEIDPVHFVRIKEENDDLRMSLIHEGSLRQQLLDRYRKRLLERME